MRYQRGGGKKRREKILFFLSHANSSSFLATETERIRLGSSQLRGGGGGANAVSDTHTLFFF